MKLSNVDWTKFLEDYELVDFEYTGAGYFPKIKTNNLNLKKETIHESLIMGQNKDFTAGFPLLKIRYYSCTRLSAPDKIQKSPDK